MQHVLVHIDQNLGPIGAWSYTEDGRLTHFYPDSLDTGISSRARLVMAQRHDDVTIPEWMDFIADNEPTLLDEYHSFDAENNLNLAEVLTEFRRLWVTTD